MSQRGVQGVLLIGLHDCEWREMQTRWAGDGLNLAKERNRLLGKGIWWSLRIFIFAPGSSTPRWSNRFRPNRPGVIHQGA
jgi:hypothetical protein